MKENFLILCDSMIKIIIGAGILRDHPVKIRPHTRDTVIDMCDYMKAELHQQRFTLWNQPYFE